MPIFFKKLQPKHTLSYRQVRLECLKNYPNYFGSNYEHQATLPQLYFEKIIYEQPSDKFIVGAFDGETLIGTCGFVQRSQNRCQHRGDIIQMYVQAAYQGKKIGLRLLKATVEEAFKIPEMEQIVLDVIANNIPANRIYEQVGFVEYGRFPNYYKINGEYFDLREMVIYRNSYIA